MPLVTIQTGQPLANFATRGGRVQADKDGYIYEVAPDSQMMADLMAQGASIVPTPAASDSNLPDPIE